MHKQTTNLFHEVAFHLILGLAVFTAFLYVVKNQSKSTSNTKDEEERNYPPTSEALEEAVARREASALKMWNKQESKWTTKPVTLLCGSLGSGKTTVVAKLLELERDFSIGVVVNDAAAVNIDEQLLRESASNGEVSLESIPIAPLTGACFCCKSSSHGDALDLRDVVEEMVKKVDAVVVEMSGVSDATLAASALAKSFRDSLKVVGVVDPDSFPPKGQTQEQARSFIEAVDVVIVSKADLLPPEGRIQIKKKCEEMGALQVVLSEHGVVDPAVLLPIVNIQPEREAFGRRITANEAAAGRRLHLAGKEEEATKEWLTRRSQNRSVGEGVMELHETYRSLVRTGVVSIKDYPIPLWAIQDALFASEEEKEIILLRIKGHVWLSSPKELERRRVEMQWSGRARVDVKVQDEEWEVTPNTQLVIIVRKSSSNSGNEVGYEVGVWRERLAKKWVFDLNKERLAHDRALEFAIELEKATDAVENLTVEAGVVSFKVSCLTRFAVSEDDLRTRFGLELSEMHRDVELKGNSFVFLGAPRDNDEDGGGEDGQNANGKRVKLLLISLGMKMCVSLGSEPSVSIASSVAWLANVIEDVVKRKFAVVKMRCDCER